MLREIWETLVGLLLQLIALVIVLFAGLGFPMLIWGKINFYLAIGLWVLLFVVAWVIAQKIASFAPGYNSIRDTPVKSRVKKGPSVFAETFKVLWALILYCVGGILFFGLGALPWVVREYSGYTPENQENPTTKDWIVAAALGISTIVLALLGAVIANRLMRLVEFKQNEITDTPVKAPPPQQQEKIRRREPAFEAVFYWLGLAIVLDQLKTGILVLGSIGSGKTSAVKLLLSKLCKHKKEAKIARMIVFSPKNDLALIPRIGKTIYLGMDKRTVNYKISDDLIDNASTTHFASHLRLQENNNAFWEEMVQQVITAVVQKLNFLAKDKWTMRQFLALIANRKLLQAFLNHFPDTAFIAETCLSDGEMGKSVHASLIAACLKLAPIASVMDKAGGEPLSASELAKMENVTLVLSWDDVYTSTLRVFHALFLECFISHLLRQKSDKLTVVCIDEYSLLRSVKGFEQLAARGRESGLILILANQTVESLHAQNPSSDAQLSNLLTLVAFHNQSATTRDWISKRAGKILTIREIFGQDTRQCLDVPAIPEEDIRRLPMADFGKNKLFGIMTSPWHEKEHFEGELRLASDPLPTEVSYEQAPEEWQRMERFTIKDAEDLNFPNDPNIRDAIK